MANAKRREQARRRLSLSVRLSLLVLFAALLPLAAVVGINDYFARGTLIDQGRTALTTDASAKATAIDNYMYERLLDGSAMASLKTTPAYLACIALSQLPQQQAAAFEQQVAASGQQLNCDDPYLGAAFFKGSNERAVEVGIVRDPLYTQWGLYSAHGDLLIPCTATHDPKNPCGPASADTKVSPVDLAKVQQGKQFISAVYYNTPGKYAYVNIYTPIAFGGQVLGFLQSSLKLDYVWSIVSGDKNANGTGSYAFITDENGIRIADADASGLFRSVKPLDAATSQQIAAEHRFGTSAPVQQDNLPAVAASLNSTSPQDSFQGSAVSGSTIPYQFVRIQLNQLQFRDSTSKVPVSWTYFVLSPLSTVTRAADDQVKISLISAAVIAVLAILLGLAIGTGTTRPVSASAADLEGAATSLKRLASRQQNSASEQQWVVDACKTGLDSVRYLSDAMNQAARRIIDASNWFGEYWDRLTEEQAKRTVQHLLELARYIDEAARRQQASSDRLGKAITVTMQVSDQLAAGANAATESADQLEHVVRNLQHVVGGRSRATSDMDDEMDEQLDQMDQLPAMPRMEPIGAAPASPYRGERSDRLEMPPQYAPRQLAAPGATPSAPDAWNAGNRSGGSQVFGGYDAGYDGGYDAGYDGGFSQNSWGNPSQGQPGRQGWNER